MKNKSAESRYSTTFGGCPKKSCSLLALPRHKKRNPFGLRFFQSGGMDEVPPYLRKYVDYQNIFSIASCSC